ncbi:MAG TPA: inositol monophosphatase family protein [Candidatus Hydrogenedens sp.]|nr:inositol monophosphatase family protein [Candidatus Hydrogenedens sp.]
MDSLEKALLDLMLQVANFTEKIASCKIKHVQTKQDYSPVTLADYGAQIIISCWLSKNFKNEPLIAEESSKSLDSNENGFVDELTESLQTFLGPLSKNQISDYLDFNSSAAGANSFWVLDPLDGTKGFLRGGQYAISLGHIDNGMVDIGILACPRLSLPRMTNRDTPGIFFYAQKGQGSRMKSFDTISDLVPIHVSESRKSTEARLLRSFESKHTDIEKTEQFLSKLGITQMIPVDSQVKYGLLACGEGELILRFPPVDNPDYREKIWDHAGGVVVLQEAGGRITDIYGKAFQYKPEPLLKDSIGVFASNGFLHELGLKALKEILSKPKER